MSTPPGGPLLRRGEVVAAAAASAVLAALGIPLGLLAAGLTPRVGMVLFQDAPDGYPHALFLQAAEEDKAAIGGDGVLLAVLAGAGLLLGLVVLIARRRAPVGAVLAALVGGALAGVVAMAVAHHVVHGGYAAVPGSALNTGHVYQLRPYVRGRVDFAVLPAAALIVFLLGNARFLWQTRASVRSRTSAAELTAMTEGPTA